MICLLMILALAMMRTAMTFPEDYEYLGLFLMMEKEKLS